MLCNLLLEQVRNYKIFKIQSKTNSLNSHYNHASASKAFTHAWPSTVAFASTTDIYQYVGVVQVRMITFSIPDMNARKFKIFFPG